MARGGQPFYFRYGRTKRGFERLWLGFETVVQFRGERGASELYAPHGRSVIFCVAHLAAVLIRTLDSIKTSRPSARWSWRKEIRKMYGTVADREAPAPTHRRNPPARRMEVSPIFTLSLSIRDVLIIGRYNALFRSEICLSRIRNSFVLIEIFKLRAPLFLPFKHLL